MPTITKLSTTFLSLLIILLFFRVIKVFALPFKKLKFTGYSDKNYKYVWMYKINPVVMNRI